jgi:Uma2 family endonuclease
MPHPARLVTAEELERFPSDDRRYELVKGRVVRMSPVGSRHGGVTIGLAFLLVQHVRAHALGAVVTEVGFVLATKPDTVRAPDLAFIRRGRIPATGLPRGFWKGSPDLAVEVLSPDDTPSEVRTKVDEYLRYGVPLVLTVDPDEKTVAVFRANAAPATLGMDQQLDLSDVVPGFRCDVRGIFE